MTGGIILHLLIATAIFVVMFFAAFGAMEAYQNDDHLTMAIFLTVLTVLVFWLSLFGGLIPFIMAGVAFALASKMCS